MINTYTVHVAIMADIKEWSQEAQYSVQRTIVQRNSVQGVLCTYTEEDVFTDVKPLCYGVFFLPSSIS